METIWFGIVTLMLAIFVVLDGFDLGVGIVYLFTARSETDRRMALMSIGPVWNGNEVWLIAGGGLLFFAFPKAYAAGFSGFYLTASWSVFAFGVFAAGMVMRERMYRWLGLGVLGAAIGRVVIFDVWRLETIYRILSFFALGLVLLVLGFIYNKYQERIRQWL